MGADRGAIGRIALTPQRHARRVGFGGAWLTGPGTYGPPPDLNAARRVVRLAAAAGIQLFDTADCYGPHVSETLIAEALYPYPDDVIVSTKGGRLALGDDRWHPDGRPEHLRRACEGSLRRLRLDAIDLYQLNAVDPAVPIEESLAALLDLRDAGLIRAIELCNLTVAELERACAVAPIASVQNRYDIHTRDADPVLELCVGRGIAFLPWFPPPNGMRAARGSRSSGSPRPAARPPPRWRSPGWSAARRSRSPSPAPATRTGSPRISGPWSCASTTRRWAR